MVRISTQLLLSCATCVIEAGKPVGRPLLIFLVRSDEGQNESSESESR